MLIILSETFGFDSVLNGICVWPYSYQGKTQMLSKTCLFDTFLDIGDGRPYSYKGTASYFWFHCVISLIKFSICVWPYSYQGKTQMLFFIGFILASGNFSRVAFVLPGLDKYKPGENKRDGGLKNMLIWNVLDIIYVWPYSYQGKTQMLSKTCLFGTFWTLVMEGQKLPNRVRWPGGGIPYQFQNIPLCPGVFHESVGKSVWEISWEISLGNQ